MFKTITSIEQLRAATAHRSEIRFQKQRNGATIACYMFTDSHTFDVPEALECRGIAFGADGSVVSRPLHKFFNLGEKAWLSPTEVAKRASEVVAVFDKLDGSMIATSWVNEEVHWRSKKSFTSDVTRLLVDMLHEPQYHPIRNFATEVASSGLTAIFEFMHPLARIVVPVEQPSFRLLHVRDNVTGEYVLLDKEHWVHAAIEKHNVPLVARHEFKSLEDLLSKLETMKNEEGYVVQFRDGDMVKLKCPWYLRLHRGVTFLRERDIAEAALSETLDDLKALLSEAGIDLEPVEEVEARVKAGLVALSLEIESLVEPDLGLDRKSFAVKHKKHPMFGLMMAQFIGKEPDFKEWFIRNRLKQQFSLRVLADGALADALEG